MKTGYDQFFKQARKAQEQNPSPRRQEPKSRPQSQAHAKPQRPTDSREMAAELRRKIQSRAPKKKSKISWKLAGVSFVGLAVTLGGLQYLDQIEAYAKKIEISFLGRAVAEETKKEAPTKESKPAQAVEAAVAPAEAASEGKRSFNQEEIDHFAKLNERKKELDAREAELSRYETELQTQKAEMDKRLQELEQTRSNISKDLEDRVQADDKKVETLVQVYSNMKPQQAAKVFETMDEDLAVEILGRMKKKNAAEIMNLIKPDKAQIFSEKYAGYKRK